MKKYLFFQKPRLIHLLFLFFFIFSLIKKTFQNIFNNQKTNLYTNMIYIYIYDISDFLALIPFIIMKKMTKKEKEPENDKNNIFQKNESNAPKIFYIYSSEEKAKIKGFYKNIFIFTISDFIAQILSIIFYLVLEGKNLKLKLANLNSRLITIIIS